MAIFSTPMYSLALCFLIFYFKTLNADQSRSFSFNDFSKDSSFGAELALYGDAKVINGDISVLQVSGSMVSSAGRVVYKKPFKLVEGNPRKMVSFSMYFVFSVSRENGDGLAFVMVPVGFPLDESDGGSFGLLGKRKDSFLAVEFDTLRDDKHGDMNDNHVGIDVGSLISVKSRNVSSINLALKSGAKLQAWVDYEASSRRLEVRLSKKGETRPYDPLLSCPIDLSQMWKDDDVVVGLSASSGNSTQKCNLYSWSFKLWTMPQWMHSEPLDPKAYIDKRQEILNVHKRSDCALRVVAAMIFGIGCGALGGLIVLFVWTILGNRRPVVPEDFAKEAEYKTTKIVVDKTIEGGNNKSDV